MNAGNQSNLLWRVLILYVVRSTYRPKSNSKCAMILLGKSSIYILTAPARSLVGKPHRWIVKKPNDLLFEQSYAPSDTVYVFW